MSSNRSLRRRPVSNRVRFPPYSMYAENPQSIFIFELLPNAS